MLRPAHIGHLALLRSLIRDAARDGAFDPSLAWNSPASERFFAELRQALKTGYFVITNERTGSVSTVAVPGYVYWADDDAGAEPVGFGMFRELNGAYELWLAGLDTTLRGKGHGKAMLGALFATPTGRKTRYIRVRRSARHAVAITHLLEEHGFTSTRDSDTETWFVRASVHAPVRPGKPRASATSATVDTEGLARPR